MPANLTVEWEKATAYRNKPDARAYIVDLVKSCRDTPSSAVKAINSKDDVGPLPLNTES